MRIILTGKGGSGKDHLKRYLIGQGHKPSVSCTTRPIREGEIDGVDYNFLSLEKFLKMKDLGYFLEWTDFNSWFYGTPRKNFEECEVFVMTPRIIAGLPQSIKDSSVVVYIDIPESERIKRLEARNKTGIHDIVERRLASDAADFEGFLDFDIRIKDPYFSPAQVEKIIKAYNGKD